MSASRSVALGELVDPVKTWSPERRAGACSFQYIDLSAIDQAAKAISGAREVPCSEAPSRARQLVAAGDVLVSTVRPNLNGVARVPAEMDGATASTGFCVLRPRPIGLAAAYLFQWIQSPSFVSEMVRRSTGASYPAVSDRIILESRIPLPPLPEQRRIAEVLDRAEALRAKRRAALAQLDTLTQSIFLDMFGDPVSNPKAWPIASLEDACEEINDCPHSTPIWTDTGLICLRTSNITEGDWNWADTRFVSEGTFHERSKRGYLEPGDIVLSREGTVGIAAIVTAHMRVCMGQRLVQVRPSPSVLVPEFALRQLLYVLAPGRIGQAMVGSTSQHLNVKELRGLPVPRPPIPLQREFVRLIAPIEKMKSAHQLSLAQLDALFASFQHRAFSGQL